LRPIIEETKRDLKLRGPMFWFDRTCKREGKSEPVPLVLHRSLLQNTVSFVGLFCKRDLCFQKTYVRVQLDEAHLTVYTVGFVGFLKI